MKNYENFEEWAFEKLPISLYRLYKNLKELRYAIKYFFQKLFRKNHTSDAEIWDLYTHLAKIIYPKLKAFIEIKKTGYPSIFSEWDENMGLTKKEYEKNSFIGGGEKAWEKVLTEMLFAFEYVLNREDEKNIPDFYKKWGIEDPHEIKPENEITHVWYRNNKTGEGLLTDEPEGLSEDWEKSNEYIFHYNSKLENDYAERAQKGFELFGKYFMNLWD